MCLYMTIFSSGWFLLGIGPRSIFDPFPNLTTLEEAEITTGKHSNTRKNPLPLTNKPRPLHDRHTRTDTCVRWEMTVKYNRHKVVTTPLLKRLRNGRFTCETATQ